MYDFLDGKNALIFSYGVTNAGKTYTIQGKHERNNILILSACPVDFLCQPKYAVKCFFL